MRRAGRIMAAAGLSLWAACLARDAGDRMIAATRLPPLDPAVSAVVLDRDGRLLRAYTVEDGLWRLPVSAADVDPRYLTALLAYEDKRFPTHPGVDAVALLRAGLQSILAGRVVSGGSTLTMQVARLLERSGTGSWRGKLRQMRVALALERRLSKRQILTLYLRLAPMGANVEGVRAASLMWFGKEPRRLTEAEIALLIALPQSPVRRRPDRHPEAARAARERVLDRLRAAGVMSPEAARAARTEALPRQRRPFPALAPHLADRLVASAASVGGKGAPVGPGVGQGRESLSARQSLGPLRTTLDRDLQAALERAAADAARAAGPGISAAILVADHRSGEILARVGSAGYSDDSRRGWVDMSRAIRSPGSTLKPLIYALAFDAGLAHPETLIDDRPQDFSGYAPQNFDRRFRGTVTVREALQMSLNLPAVALLDAIGPADLVARMRRAGARVRLPGDGRAGLAVALGGVGVDMEGLASIYAALANGGRVVDLHDRPRASRDTVPARLVSPEAAWMVGDILAGLPPPPHAPRGRLAYKTGTSYGSRDAWAIGFDGVHVVAAWLGRADGTSMPGALGAELAAPLLFSTFARLKPRPEPLPAPPPSVLTVATSELPLPLQRFRGPRDRVAVAQDAPRISYPPDGALVDLELDHAGGGLPLVVRVAEGRPPFTWLADGRPVAIGTPARQIELHPDGPGVVTLAVIDARGRSQHVTVTVE